MQQHHITPTKTPFFTPPRIPQPSPLTHNNEQLLHVILQERQIQHQQRFPTPIRNHTPTTMSSQNNSPNYDKQYRVSVLQQMQQNEMQTQYTQIMQYYKELEQALHQQKQETVIKYNEIVNKIDGVQQIMLQNLNQLNINQKKEYQALFQELQQQRLENQQRFESLFLQQQQQQQQQIQQQQQYQQQQFYQQQQCQQNHNQQQPGQNNLYLSPQRDLIQREQVQRDIIQPTLEEQLFPQEEQKSYRQIHSNKSNHAVKSTRSPGDQLKNKLFSPQSDTSLNHQKKQIFEKPIFEQISNKPIFQNIPQPPFRADESIIIEEPKNSTALLQQLKSEYGINSLSQTATLQYTVSQLQLIYCLFCNQYITLQLAENHMQVCSATKPQRRQNDNYLDLYIIYRDDELLESKQRLLVELQRIKLLIQLALAQKWTTPEHLELRDYCQMAVIILDRLLQNPYHINRYLLHLQQIFNVVYLAPQIFYKQQAILLQKCLTRLKEYIK